MRQCGTVCVACFRLALSLPATELSSCMTGLIDSR